MTDRHGRSSLIAWWYLAERAFASLTAPKLDIAAADRSVEALLRDSWLWRCGVSLSASIGAAWLDSRCRRLLRSFAGVRPTS